MNKYKIKLLFEEVEGEDVFEAIAEIVKDMEFYIDLELVEEQDNDKS